MAILKYRVRRNCIVNCARRGKRYFAGPDEFVYLEELKPGQNRGGQLELAKEQDAPAPGPAPGRRGRRAAETAEADAGEDGSESGGKE